MDLVQRILKDAKDLPTLPTVYSALCDLIASSKSNAQAVAELISTDQASASRLLRVANSAFFGFSGKIETISRAVVLLGFDEEAVRENRFEPPPEKAQRAAKVVDEVELDHDRRRAARENGVGADRQVVDEVDPLPHSRRIQAAGLLGPFHRSEVDHPLGGTVGWNDSIGKLLRGRNTP